MSSDAAFTEATDFFYKSFCALPEEARKIALQLILTYKMTAIGKAKTTKALKAVEKKPTNAKAKTKTKTNNFNGKFLTNYAVNTLIVPKLFKKYIMDLNWGIGDEKKLVSYEGVFQKESILLKLDEVMGHILPMFAVAEIDAVANALSVKPICLPMTEARAVLEKRQKEQQQDDEMQVGEV